MTRVNFAYSPKIKIANIFDSFYINTASGVRDDQYCIFYCCFLLRAFIWKFDMCDFIDLNCVQKVYISIPRKKLRAQISIFLFEHDDLFTEL